MEANEAPEKLYIDVRDSLSDSILYGFTEKRKEDDIEYTRTDAFMKKAAKWLRNCLDNGMWVDQYLSEKDKEAIVLTYKENMEEEFKL